MISDSLNALSADLTASHVALARARQTRAGDKHRRRQQGLVARLADLLWLTPAAIAQCRAFWACRKLASQSRKAARAWIRTRVAELAIASPAVIKRRTQLHAAIVQTTDRLKQLEALLELAVAARTDVLAAKRACGFASNMKMVDTFTTTKTFAAWSTLEVGGARRAVERAERSIRALQEAIPGSAQSLAVKVPSDLLSLLVNFHFEPAVNVFSFLNMRKLAAAARSCEVFARSLEPLIAHLTECVRSAHAESLCATHALATHDAPLLQAATDELPNNLRALVVQ